MKEILKVEMNLDEYLQPKMYFFINPDDEDEDTELSLDNFEKIIKATKYDRFMLDGLMFFCVTLGETFCAIKRDMTDLYKEIKALKEQIK